MSSSLFDFLIAFVSKMLRYHDGAMRLREGFKNKIKQVGNFGGFKGYFDL